MKLASSYQYESTTSNRIFLDDVVAGLSQKRKTLPCKYFYDEYGSQIFDKICDCQDYYLTRTEISVLQEIAPQIAEIIGENVALIEPGAGAIRKVAILLESIQNLSVYIPIDISGSFLNAATQRVQKQFPEINTHSVIGDFTEKLHLENVPFQNQTKRNVIFFPGSTFGNFHPNEGKRFLENMRSIVGEEGGLIIGIDLVKETEILERAYDDSGGITAIFNKNILRRINDELVGDFDLTQFTHRAIFNTLESRVEMHLESQSAQKITIDGYHFFFAKGETIHTENSYKYTKENFAILAESAGFPVRKYWSDAKNLFSVQYLSAKQL